MKLKELSFIIGWVVVSVGYMGFLGLSFFACFLNADHKVVANFNSIGEAKYEFPIIFLTIPFAIYFIFMTVNTSWDTLKHGK